MKTVRYYHATDEKNIASILTYGLKLKFAELYCSTNRDTAVRWICFTRRGAKRVAVLSFDRPADDKSMHVGTDHAPLMLSILGAQQEGASFVSDAPIPAEDINYDDIIVYENHFYSEEFVKMMEKVQKDNQKILDSIAAEGINDD